jgi:hypothetical protein
LTEAELQAIAARCEAASPGPWARSHSGVPGGEPAAVKVEPIVLSLAAKNRRGGPMIVASTRWPLASLGATDAVAEANAAFIAEARRDVPRLVAEVQRLRERLARAERQSKRSTEPSAEL